MSAEGIRIGVGTRVLHDGQLWEVTELHPGPTGTEVVLGAYGRHSEVVRISLRELLDGHRARVYGEGPGPNSDDPVDPADVVLSALSASERDAVRQRAGDIREVLTGYRSGTAEFAQPGEPRTGYDPALPLTARYAAKAAELGISMRTVQSWAADYLAYGEAGLARGTVSRQNPTGRVDERWVQTAVEVMVEHTDQSRLSLATQALANAVARRGDVAGCIVHSDRGSQFRSRKFVLALGRHDMVGSMGRVGAAGDNAAMESFFSLLQKNVLDRRRWDTREELRIAIVTWIERTYHRRRRQVGLGRLTPIEFEAIMTAPADQAA